MQFSSSKLSFVLFAAIFIEASLGELICEHLPSEMCALAISSSGRRCVLEKYKNENGENEYVCKTSEVIVGGMSEYIETDECVEACGVDRKMVGISSDNLLEPQFTSKLCSPACYNRCPNIVDLYLKLAEGEGVYLPNLCKKQRRNPRRALVDLMSSGAALGPVSSASMVANAPAPAPVSITI